MVITGQPFKSSHKAQLLMEKTIIPEAEPVLSGWVRELILNGKFAVGRSENV